VRPREKNILTREGNLNLAENHKVDRLFTTTGEKASTGGGGPLQEKRRKIPTGKGVLTDRSRSPQTLEKEVPTQNKIHKQEGSPGKISPGRCDSMREKKKLRRGSATGDHKREEEQKHAQKKKGHNEGGVMARPSIDRGNRINIMKKTKVKPWASGV